MNYDKDYKDIQVLMEIGVPSHELNGYSVIEGEEFILREYHTNQREQGYEVPEKYIPDTKTRKEREINYQSKMMHDLEGERVNRTPEGFPDPYKWYDDEEMCLDSNRENVPIWLRDLKERQAKKEEDWLKFCREKHKRGMNISSAQRLQEIRGKKIKKEEEGRSKALEKAIRERDERLEEISSRSRAADEDLADRKQVFYRKHK